MKTKNFLFLFLACITMGGLIAQEDNSSNSDADCTTEIQLFAQSAKIEDYDSAKPHYDKLIENCPKEYIALYQYGRKMFRHYIENTEDDATKKEYAKALIKNYQMRQKYFPEKTELAHTYRKVAEIKFNNKLGSAEELYKAFDKAYKEDPENFDDPKDLYIYFSLLIDLQDAGKRSLEDVFKKYDEIKTKIEKEEAFRAEEEEKLTKKKEAGEELSEKEQRTLHNDEIYLRNYVKVKESIDAKIGKRADCENLIPLYTEKFDEKKTDKDWLKMAAHRLSVKKCTDGEIFVKITEALNDMEPSAKTAKYLGQLALDKGNTSKAIEYFKQSIELEDNKLDKAKVLFFIGDLYKKQGSLSAARNYFLKALKNKPSLGRAYLRIANMYANSANNCGGSIFEKRAVYWLAADYADRAARVDPSLKSTAQQYADSYRGRAPSREDIFNHPDLQGTTIKFDCWINESVTVPKL